jgi:propanol-preferring alcohol dehydrogenase
VRVKAAGICHSDAHYRAGTSPVRSLPLTPGHEVAGVVERTGEAVRGLAPGDRVCLHYNVTCGDCPYCASGNEQFCATGFMVGHHADVGYAECVVAPARNAQRLVPAKLARAQRREPDVAADRHARLEDGLDPGDHPAAPPPA